MTSLTFDAQPTAALFDASGAVLARGDGSIRFEDGSVVEAHDGAVLCAVRHPSGRGVITGGDDGRLVWSQPDEAAPLADARGRWIDSVAASPESGLVAYSAGKVATVLDASDAAFRREFTHERTVSGLAFDPKGRRLVASTYGGAALWYARIADQQPALLKWAGSHTGVAVSPDGAFVVTAMQDNQLHGWRLKDQRNLRMGGYPAKIRSMAFLSNGKLLATAGASGVVMWPFAGSDGPMGKEASEIGFEEGSLVVLVAAAVKQGRVAAGLNDGRVWWADPAGQGLAFVKAERGAPICALAMSDDGTRLAWGDEDGQAGIADL